MIKHIVIWRMKEDVTAEQKAEMKTRLEALKEVVVELADIDVGIDDGNGTMSLDSEFTTVEEGLELLERYYPGRPIEAKVGFFLEELLASRG